VAGVRGRTASVALAVASLPFAAALAEALVRAAIALYHLEPIVVSHPRLGWVDRPELRNVLKVYAGGRYWISTDAEGHRLSSPQSEPASPSPTVLLAGDSFVEGVGVDDRETFAWRLAAAGFHVVNLGVLGYGTEQEVLSVEEFIANHPGEPIAAIVLFVFDNDFVDVQRPLDPYLGRTRPVLREHNGRLDRVPYRVPAIERAMDVSRLVWLLRSKWTLSWRAPDPPLEPGIDLVVGSLATLREVAQRQQISLHVLLHHRVGAEPALFAASAKRFLDASGAVDITGRIRSGPGDPIGGDGAHWSAEGHRRVAAIVEEMLGSNRAEQRTKLPIEHDARGDVADRHHGEH